MLKLLKNTQKYQKLLKNTLELTKNLKNSVKWLEIFTSSLSSLTMSSNINLLYSNPSKSSADNSSS